MGTTDLGLRRSDTRVRLRYLNHAPALSDIEIPLSHAATLFPHTPPRVVSVAPVATRVRITARSRRTSYRRLSTTPRK